MQTQFSIALLEQKDTKSLFELIQNNATRLYKYFPITLKENCSLIAAENYVNRKIREAAAKENYTFKIVANDILLPIGMLIIKNIDWKLKTCELAYFIDAAYEGKGYITHGVSQLIYYAKEKLQLQKASLSIGEDNFGSLRIAEKHGFILKKRIENGHVDFYGNIMDVLHFECNL